MNLTGGRTTLKLNISALVLALIINIEAAYITYRAGGGSFGRIRSSSLSQCS